MLFGRGATGGVINQVSKVPMLDTMNEISATVGSTDHFRVTGDFNTPMSDSSAARVNLFGQDLHSTRDVMYNRDAGLAPSLRFGVGTPTQITLSALLQHNHDMPDYGLPPINAKPAKVDDANFYGLTDDHTDQNVAVAAARIEHAFSDTFTLRNQTQYSHYTTDARETAPNTVQTADATVLDRNFGNYTSLPLDQLYVQLASHDRDIRDSSIFNQTDLVGKFDTGSWSHTFIAGAEVGRDTYSNQSYNRDGLPLLSLLDPQYMGMPADSTSTPGNYAHGYANTAAVYANDAIKFNPQWQFVVGLRQDRYAANLHNSASTPADADQTVYFTSQRAGLIYQPSDTQSYYASYGTSFDPSLEALTVRNGTQALPPEKNKSFELGGKWDVIDEHLSVTAALFQVEKTNARTKIATGEYELDGNVRVRGGEIGASGHVTQRWQVFAGYTHLNARIVEAADGTQGNVLANTPENSATLWNSYAISPQWELGGGVTYLSKRYANNSDVVSVGGYTRWDASIAYHQPNYDLRFNLLNLGNKHYFDALIPSDGGRSIPESDARC